MSPTRGRTSPGRRAFRYQHAPVMCLPRSTCGVRHISVFYESKVKVLFTR